MLARWENIEAFSKAHNPGMQLSICKDSRTCFLGQYPTLAGLDRAYGQNAAPFWLVPELVNLSEFCGCNGKLAGGALKECAVIIAQQYSHLKTSEVMLFFYRFKAGLYGRFYGSVDPLVIMQGLLEFSRERAAFLERHENERRMRREAEEAKRAVTYSEYKKMRFKTDRTE